MLINLLFIAITAFAKEPTRIAVIDGGFNQEIVKTIKLCDNIPVKLYGKNSRFNYHGDGIIKLIKKYAGNSNYCFILVTGLGFDVVNSIKAIYYATKRNADVISYSGGGDYFNQLEYIAIKKFLTPNKKFFVSTGNSNSNLNINCTSFPACYKLNVTPVANRHSYANTLDRAIISISDDDILGGTSGSTAIQTGLYVKSLWN